MIKSLSISRTFTLSAPLRWIELLALSAQCLTLNVMDNQSINQSIQVKTSRRCTGPHLESRSGGEFGNEKMWCLHHDYYTLERL